MRFETELGRARDWASFWAAVERAVIARRGAVALLCIVLVSLVFRLHLSRECSLWLDEAITHFDVLKPWHVVLSGPSRAHPPLMYVLVKAAVSLLGTSETGLRSVSLVFGCVLLAATFELCLELGLTVGRALVVVGTLSLSPFFVRHATEARQYAMLAAFVVLATTRVLRVLRGTARSMDFIGFALAALAAACTQYFGLAYAMSLLAVLVAGGKPAWRHSQPPRRALLAGLLLLLLLLLALVAVHAARVHRLYAVETLEAEAGPALNAQLLREIPLEFSFMTYATWSFLVQPVLAVCGLSLLSWRSQGVARVLPLGLGIAPCVAALFLASTHSVAARYLAPSAILYHLGACVALFAAVDRLRLALSRRVAPARPTALLGWLVLSALLLARVHEFPNGLRVGGDDYRGLQRYFISQLAKDTRLVAYSGFFGQLLLGKEYRVGSPPISLEEFRAVRGIRRYLVVEIHVDQPERRADLESLIEREFGLSPKAWRALPLVPLPHSIYQPAVAARLIQLPLLRKPSPPRNRRRKP